jgi:3-isopropylmalate dehydrogenase
VKTYRIAAVAGDGIGPEVMAEGLRVLRRAAEIESFSIEATEYPFSADHYLATGETLADGFLDEVRGMDAVLVGAIGDPRLEVGMLERAVISGLRFGLDLFVNLRPVRLYAEHLCPLKDRVPRDIDMIVVRENTEDVYTNLGGIFKKGSVDEVAIQEMIFTRRGTERVIRYAFELARKRGGRKKLTMVDKANAIRAMDVWTRTFAEVGAEYPDITQNHLYIDAACMFLVKDPQDFDVVVVPNMFGDILTDLGAMITGGLGVAASGNIHPGQVSMFEPVHGSAPDIAGQNIASPVATILSVSMMLDYLGEERAARRVENTVASLLADRRIPSLGADSGLTTAQVGDLVVDSLQTASAASSPA